MNASLKTRYGYSETVKNLPAKPRKKKSSLMFPKIFITCVLAFMYLPLVIAVVYSFNDNRIALLWGGFSTKWYKALFQDQIIFNALKNSLILAASSSLIAGVVGSLAAVGFAQDDLPLKKITSYISTLPIMIPEIILGIVFLTYFSLLQIPTGMMALVIGHSSFCIPYVFILVKGRLAGSDKSLVEAARDLGASRRKAFLTITLPMISPAIISGMIMSFVMSFDDVIISVFVSGVNSNTLPLYIYTQIKTTVTPKTYAICALMFFISALLVFLSKIVGKINNRTKKQAE